MNQKNLVLAGIGILILASAGGIFFLNSSQNNMLDEKMMKQNSSEEKTMNDDNSIKKDTMMDKSSDSKYLEYSKSNLESASDTRRVLFFYASWCPTCRPADQNIKSSADKISEDLVVIRVNYNDPDTDQEEKDLAKKYNVTYQHTFVQIDKNGTEVTKWNGGQIDEILTNIK